MAEERPAPKTKEQLIALLKQQLNQVQDDISNMQNTLEQERSKRSQLTQELNEKQKLIEQLIENESKTLGDKVNEGLYNTLQTANKIRAQAQQQVRSLTEDNNIVNEKIVHKDTKVKEDRQNIILNQKKVGVLEQKRTDLQRKQAALVGKKEQIKRNYQVMKKELERLENEEKELTNNLQNARKLRMYLNKHLEGSLKSAANNLSPIRKGDLQSPGRSDQDGFWNS